ncbi:MAG TPA: hypothetical protein VMS64_40640 [Candidatus Methylomirabilis sp.]|nr:hypothetical protein [Candidatus Methylomirabilis sp.]
MGDLRERYSSVPAYLVEAATVVPHVVASRVRRSFDGGLVLFEYIGLSTIFNTSTRASAAVWPRTTAGWAGVPLAVVLGVLILCDAYVPVEPAPVRDGARLDALFDSSLIRAVRHVLLALACVWLAEWVVGLTVPTAHVPAPALIEMSGAIFLMVGAMRTAWWTMFTPGSRAMGWPVVPLNWPAVTSASGAKRPGFPTWNLGEIVWMLLAAPLAPAGWRGLVAARTPAESLTAAVILAAAGFVIYSACRGLVLSAPAGSTAVRPSSNRALLEARLRTLSRWPLRAVLVVGAYWCDAFLSGLHGLADPALIGALSAVAVHVMGQRIAKNFQQELDTIDQDA